MREEGVRDSRWGEDGQSDLAAEDAPEGGKDIVRYRIKDGRRTVLAAATALVPKGSGTPLAIGGYPWPRGSRPHGPSPF